MISIDTVAATETASRRAAILGGRPDGHRSKQQGGDKHRSLDRVQGRARAR
jgi:hypothetical protein